MGNRVKKLEIDRRRYVGAALLSALIGAPLLAGAQGKPEKSRVVLALGSKAAFTQLPLLVAGELGYFRAEGLELEFLELGSDAAVLHALTGGQADIASAGFENLIALHGRGMPYRSFMQLGRAPQLALGISTRQSPKATSLRVIKGQKVGVTQLGSTAHLVADTVLRQAGVATAELAFVEVGAAASAMAALRSAHVEMLCTSDPTMTQLEQRGEVRILSDTRNLKGVTEVFGGAVPSGCLFAPIQFLERNPGTVQALANAASHALKWLQTAGPSDVIRTIPESYLLGDRALYLACFERTREAMATDGLTSLDSARLLLRALANFDGGIKAAQIPLVATFTNDFSRRAKDKFKL